MKFIDMLLLFSLGALWGGSYLFMRIAGPVLGSVFLISIRSVIAAAALLLYAYFTKDLPDLRRRWKQFLLIGLLNNAVPFILVTNAVIGLNAGMAAIINATTPLFTAVVAAVWIGEPFGRRRIFGIVLGILGVGILMGWSPLPLTKTVLLSAAQAVLAALCYGLAAVYGRTRFRDVPARQVAAGQLLGTSFLLFPFTFFTYPASLPSAQVILAVLTLSVACTSLAYIIYFRLITSAGAVQTSTVTFLVPFFSLLWATLFLGERVSLGMFAGLGVILVSVYLVLGVGKRPRPILAPGGTVK
jgi:drug/metabolite transporter (DMT)-like permease